MILGDRPKPVEPRFWARVDKKGSNDCWEWTAGKFGVGYGKICVNGKARGAHRVSLWLAGKMDLESEAHVCHTCDNPGCVNPAHLWAGDRSQNMADAHAKGRMVHQTNPERLARGDRHAHRWNAELRRSVSERQMGEKSHRAKLTEADVRSIFEMRMQKMTQREIACHFGVTREEVGQILRRKAWGHLTGLPDVPTRRTNSKWS